MNGGCQKKQKTRTHTHTHNAIKHDNGCPAISPRVARRRTSALPSFSRQPRPNVPWRVFAQSQVEGGEGTDRVSRVIRALEAGVTLHARVVRLTPAAVPSDVAVLEHVTAQP